MVYPHFLLWAPVTGCQDYLSRLLGSLYSWGKKVCSSDSSSEFLLCNSPVQGFLTYTPEVKHLPQVMQIFHFIIMFFMRLNDDQFLWGSCFWKSNNSHFLASLWPDTNTTHFPSCNTANPRKQLYLWWSAPTNLTKRPSLCLLCRHITCSHIAHRSVATIARLPPDSITWFPQQNQGQDFRGSAPTLEPGFSKDWALQRAAKYRPALHAGASVVAFVHKESWALWKIWSPGPELRN